MGIMAHSFLWVSRISIIHRRIHHIFNVKHPGATSKHPYSQEARKLLRDDSNTQLNILQSTIYLQVQEDLRDVSNLLSFYTILINLNPKT